ncbi:MAG: PA14 domain-containing protein [bacterium]|nr:PA14 domain-containing protein [bacterium]
MPTPLVALKVRVKKIFLPIALVALILTSYLTFFPRNTQATEIELLSSPWILTGNKGASEKYQTINPQVLKGKDRLRLTYNLHGECLIPGDASAIVFDQPAGVWHFATLAKYGRNCFDGVQTVEIPLSDFPGLNLSNSVALFHVRFWGAASFTIDLSSAVVSDSQTATTIPSATPSPVAGGNDSYTAEYWNTPGAGSSPSIPQRAPDLTRQDKDVDFIWDQGTPDPKIDTNHFIARWSKTQYFDAGTYHFASVSDDGIRVYVNNQLIINRWNDHPISIYAQDLTMPAGDYALRVEYYDNTGTAIAELQVSQIKAAPISTPTPTLVPTSTPSLLPTSVLQPTPTPTTATVSPSGTATWSIQSVSSMKETKDKICGQDSQNFINSWVDKAKELGANYVAVETPYDNPACGDALAYTQAWVNTIRSRGLKVWHRHMPLAFESIYNVPKATSSDKYLTMISNYIKNNPSLFADGDIFSPIPEPQNGGIDGVTGCANGVCQFSGPADFNSWLRNAIDSSNNAFSQIGLGGKIKIGYYGFDGFVAWGDNNPDWNGILEDSTVQKMGNITIDHYPELVGGDMTTDLQELEARYPNTPIIIGEWGSTGTTNLTQQVNKSMGAAAADPNVIGFNYWHMGMGGNEALINSDFTNREQFSTVQSYFK